MYFRLIALPFQIRLLALSALCCGGVAAYDSPDFTHEVFSRDGIFLPEDQRASLLEALAAIASNFADNPRVDDDLREKALAIALRLDPLHYYSRIAHRKLLNGENPGATPYFTSLTQISETLWTLSRQLLTPPMEPEERLLAPFLIELSLITQPEPSAERLEAYGAVIEKRAPAWEQFVTLEAASNRSTSRTESLRLNAGALLKEARRARANRATAPPEEAAPFSNNSPPPASEPSPDSRSTIPSVVFFDGQLVSGIVSLTIRAPASRREHDLLDPPADALATTAPPLLPLLQSPEGMRIGGYDIAHSFAAERSWIWPPGVIGEIAFLPTTEQPRDGVVLSPSVAVPTMILLESALRKVPINSDCVVVGEVSHPSAAPHLQGDTLETIATAAALKKRYLLFPDPARESLVTALQTSWRLDLLFEVELVAYSTLEEAIATATDSDLGPLLEASEIFGEIREVSERMSLVDLARNVKVQEKLESVLAIFPQHLSARAMLEFGKLPPSPE